VVVTFTPQVLTDVRLYYAAADLTGFSNKVELSAKAESLDRTTFTSDGWNERIGGLFSGALAADVFWQAGDLSMPDDSFWANLGVATVPVTAVPTGGAVADLAYLTRALQTDYQPGAKVGELLMSSVSAETNWPIARGQILHPQGTARTTTGAGTAVQLGAVDADHALYVTLHVMSYVDGSLTVAIDSDNDSGMGSATTQGTFTASTALDGQTMKIAGGIADDWWRASWSISGGVTHSFLFAVAAGIGPK
jgi:hypothetical protein